MIVLATRTFQDDMNALSKDDYSLAKNFAATIYKFLCTVKSTKELFEIPFSNYRVYREMGKTIQGFESNYDIYKISFEKFNIIFAIAKSGDPVCCYPVNLKVVN